MFTKQANIVIVGGGVIGTSTAFHLAEAGHEDIVVLDSGPIANGSTQFAAGQTAHLTSHKNGWPFSLYCTEFFENFGEKTGYPINFCQSGSIRIAMTEAYLHRVNEYVAAALELGEERVHLITAREAKEMAPLLELPEEPAGILYNGGDGYVEPKSVALAYVAGARDRGVKVHSHTRVTGIQIEEGEAKAVHTERGTIRANWIVLAAGAWTRQIAQQVGVNVASVPVRHQAYVTAPMREVDPKQPIVRVIEPQLYVRPEGGGLLVGGYGYRPISFDMDEFPKRFEIPSLEPDRIYYARLAETAARFFPILRHAIMVQERRGLPTITPDSGMIISQAPQAKGLVIASGCQVAGVAYSPAIGHIVTDLISGQQSPLTADMEFELNRFAHQYPTDAQLRARCEHVYGTMYWGLKDALH